MPPRCKLPTGLCVDLTIDECRAQGGTFFQEGCFPPGPCFVRTVITRALAENIAMLGATASLPLQFRENLLAVTPRGKVLIEYYLTHLDELFGLAASDPDLIAASIKTWLSAFPFVEGMVKIASEEDLGPSTSDKPRPFSKDLHSRCVKLISQFRSASANKAFKAVLDEVEAELREFVGLTPAEAVEKLRNSPSKRKGKSKPSRSASPRGKRR